MLTYIHVLEFLILISELSTLFLEIPTLNKEF